MLELLREEYHDTVGECMTIFNFHVSLNIVLGGQISQSDFKLNFVPVNHRRCLIIVLGGLHVLISQTHRLLGHLVAMLGGDDLTKLTFALVSKLLQVND
jgi:hypothetical protein